MKALLFGVSRRLAARLRRERRRLYEVFGNGKYTPRPALGGLDCKLEKHLDFKGGFFVEAGANDGFKQSNTYYLEFGRRWKGLLVEPVPQLCDRCTRLRRRSKVFNYALIAPDSKQEQVKIFYADLMSVMEGAMPKEVLDQHIRRGLELQKIPQSYVIKVPARTLEAILEEAGVAEDAIDFLSLDVEGGELDVLKGLNLNRFRPKLILVEARYYREVNAFLSANGYTQEDKLSVHDYLYRDSRTRRRRQSRGFRRFFQ